MKAVIKAGGQQFLVEPGQVLNIDLVDQAAKKLEFETLLVIDGSKIQVGTPVVKGVNVTAEVVGEAKGQKLQVLKFKAKKRVKKRTGHRQHYTQIKITAIGSAKPSDTKASTAKSAPKTEAKKPAAVAAK